MPSTSLVSSLDMSLDSLIESSYGKVKVDRRGGDRSSPYGRKGASSSSCRVFVGNLPYSVRWQELKDHMRAAGTVVHCDIIEEPGTAMGSKGCGLVEFSSPEEAARAIRDLSDTVICAGRPIFVREDRETGVSIAAAAHGGASGGSKGRDRREIDAGVAGGSGGDAGSCSVFVGNLAYSVTWRDLKDHMRAAGDVLRCDIIPAPGTTMGSKGCGLVEFATPGAARRAIRQLTDTELKGRNIFVREDREVDDAALPGSRGGGKGRGLDAKGGSARISSGSGIRRVGGSSGSCRVFVGNLPYCVTWRELKDHMRAAGEVVHCDVLAEPGTAMGSKGCGLVEYATPQAARKAIQRLSDTYLEGRPIWVREDREDPAC